MHRFMQIGFEIWTMQNDILFDNIYIGHSIEDAQKLQAETFDVKQAVEEEEEEALEDKAKSEPKKAKSPLDLKFLDAPLHYMREKLDLFITIAKNDPVQAAKFVPEVAGGLALLLVAVIATLIGIVSMGASSPQVKNAAGKAKATATEKKDQVVDATATGIEKVDADVQKRTTTSSRE